MGNLALMTMIHNNNNFTFQFYFATYNLSDTPSKFIISDVYSFDQIENKWSFIYFGYDFKSKQITAYVKFENSLQFF